MILLDHVLLSKRKKNYVNFLDDLNARSRANVKQLERKTAWLEKKFSVQDFGVQVKETVQGQKGAVKFQMPLFERVNISKDKKNLWDAAIEMDKKLQVYLKAYKAGQLEKMEVQEVVENQIEEIADNNENKSIRDGYKYEDVSGVTDLPF